MKILKNMIVTLGIGFEAFLCILFFMPNEIIVYKINSKDSLDQDVVCQIRDLKNYDAGDPTTAVYREVALVGGAEPVMIETFNAQRTVYGIFGKRAVITFRSTQLYGMHTFSEGEDGRFDVYIYVNGEVKFKGFVVMDDNEEGYVPPGTEVTIVAT